MRFYFFLIFLIFCISCGYPDIDTVPSFEDLKLTKEESIDLCNLASPDKEELIKCIESIDNE